MLILAAAIAAGVTVFFALLPVTYKDWVVSFRPAALELTAPYAGRLLSNPPWLFPILFPFALLPERWGAAVWILASLIVMARYAGSPWKALVVGVSAPMVALYTLGQVDAISLLGMMIPAGLGLPLLLIKPQGVFLAILPRINRKSLLLSGAVMLGSVVIWGFWWKEITGADYFLSASHNVSFFPYGLLAGIPLLVLGWRKKSDGLLCLASLCCSPYFMTTSMLPAVAALVKESNRKLIDIIVWLGSWVIFFVMRYMTGAIG